MASVPKIAASRIVVLMPNWLGDGVMATPFLRALRGLYPGARIVGVARPLVAPVLSGLPFVDEVFVAGKGEDARVVEFLRAGKFELGVLLPNSFRSAWVLWRGGVRRRVGYRRGGRRWLLTDALAAERRSVKSYREHIARFRFQNAVYGHDYVGGTAALLRYEPIEGKRFSYRQVMQDRRTGEIYSHQEFGPGGLVPWSRGYQPVPTIEYYLELARYLRGDALAPVNRELDGDFERRMELGVTTEEREEAERILGAIQNSEFGIQNLVTIVPGANFGSSKCWLPERFAAVADRLMEERGGGGARVVIASSPAERGIVDAILAASRFPGRMVALATLNQGKGVSLGALKEIVRRSSLMVCNDTGPRHFAAAFGVPTVTLFGPTDPVWAETYHERERIVRVGEAEAPCSPCQLKKCPIDHRCMTRLTVEMVMGAVGEVLGKKLNS